MDLERRTQMSVARGWVPVTKLEFNILVKGDALAKMGFPKVEVDKMQATFRARKQLPKFTKMVERNVQALSEEEGRKQSIPSPEPLSCDVCKKSVYWVLKRFAPESYHGDWSVMQFCPERADEPQITRLTPTEYDRERTYSVIPPRSSN